MAAKTRLEVKTEEFAGQPFRKVALVTDTPKSKNPYVNIATTEDLCAVNELPGREGRYRLAIREGTRVTIYYCDLVALRQLEQVLRVFLEAQDATD